MKRFTIFILMFLPLCLQAQFGETIRTGRPGQAIGPYTLGIQVVQLQTGYNYNRADNDLLERNITSSNTVIRLGITERVEVSGLFNWISEENEILGVDNSRGGMNAFHLGGRVNITENEGWVPAIGLQSRMILNVVNQDYRADNLGNAVLLATGNKLAENWSLTTNWGITWDGNNDTDATGRYVLNVGHSIDEKWGVFVETYGNFDDSPPNIDTGISYLVNPDFQLDFSGGWQGEDGITDWFIDAGLSWRLVWREGY